MNVINGIFNIFSRESSSGARVCKTRAVNDMFFECKVKKPNPKYCQYSLASGDGFICRHEDRKAFAKK